MIDFLAQPNWMVSATVGALIGAIFTDYKGIALYPFRRLKRTKYCGEWEEYHWSWIDGKKRMFHAHFEITRGLISQYSVKVSFPTSASDSPSVPKEKVLSYDGSLFLEEGHVLIDLRASSHVESSRYRFPDWVPSSENCVVGLWLAFDHGHLIASGGALLSKEKMSRSQAARIIASRMSISDGLIRVVNKA